jgi:hypothetical protein
MAECLFSIEIIPKKCRGVAAVKLPAAGTIRHRSIQALPVWRDLLRGAFCTIPHLK